MPAVRDGILRNIGTAHSLKAWAFSKLSTQTYREIQKESFSCVGAFPLIAAAAGARLDQSQQGHAGL